MQVLKKLDSVKTRICEAITVLKHAHDDVGQCRGALKRGNRYCATGVLAKHWGWIPDETYFDPVIYGYEPQNNDTAGYTVVNEKIGQDLVREIVNWNDNGKTFQEIAEKLEKRLNDTL